MLLFREFRELSHRNLHAFPQEREDETNLGPFVQIKLFSQAIFQCHISLSLIHEVDLSHWYHLSSSSQATSFTLGRLMSQRNICQSKICGGYYAFPFPINHKEAHESYMLESGKSPEA